jgi:hypothetical protein
MLYKNKNKSLEVCNMGTFTAQILVGKKHSYDSGIINISHSLFLSENSSPAWILSPLDLFEQPEQPRSRITWIPTIENMLEDALVMIGLYVLKDEKLLRMAEKHFTNPRKDFIELYNDINQENLQELYNQTQLIKSGHKITLSVFEGSSILKQLPVLKKYQNDIEVCQSIFKKEYSPWSKQFETIGDLD